MLIDTVAIVNALAVEIRKRPLPRVECVAEIDERGREMLLAGVPDKNNLATICV